MVESENQCFIFCLLYSTLQLEPHNKQLRKTNLPLWPGQLNVITIKINNIPGNTRKNFLQVIKISYLVVRPESKNASRNFPKFHLLYFSVFLLYSYYTPKLPTILSIVMENVKLFLKQRCFCEWDIIKHVVSCLDVVKQPAGWVDLYVKSTWLLYLTSSTGWAHSYTMLQVTTLGMQCDTPSIARKEMKQNGAVLWRVCFFIYFMLVIYTKPACMCSPNFKCLVSFIYNLVHTFERERFFRLGLCLFMWDLYIK